jgi:hypothetical protein
MEDEKIQWDENLLENICSATDHEKCYLKKLISELAEELSIELPKNKLAF